MWGGFERVRQFLEWVRKKALFEESSHVWEAE